MRYVTAKQNFAIVSISILSQIEPQLNVSHITYTSESSILLGQLQCRFRNGPLDYGVRVLIA